MQPSYSKYVWSSAFCTLAGMALIASIWKIFAYNVSDAEPWILAGISALLIWFIREMIWIMCSPLGPTVDWKREKKRNSVSLLQNSYQPEHLAASQERYVRAAEISGNVSAELKNPDSWIRTYFRLLNVELNSHPFPRYA